MSDDKDVTVSEEKASDETVSETENNSISVEEPDDHYFKTDEESTPPATETPAAKPRQLGVKITLALTLLVSIAALAAAGYLFLTQQKISQKLSQTASQSALNDTGSQLEKVSQSISSAETRISKQVEGIKLKQDVPLNAINQLEKELDLTKRSLSQVQNDIKQLELIAGQNARDWAISEAGYLVAIAWHQLQFNHNTPTAIDALNTAESRLRGLNDPKLPPARQAIQADVARLKNLKVPELTAIATELTGLETLIFDLDVPMPRLKMPEPDAAEVEALAKQEPDSVQAAADRAWKTFKLNMGKYIQIHQEKPKAVPIMSEEAQQSLRQSLRIKLQTASSALVTRDTALFRQSLITIESWVDEYYDPASKNIKAVYLAIHELKKVELSPQMPDLKASRDAILKISSPSLNPVLNPAQPKPAGNS